MDQSWQSEKDLGVGVFALYGDGRTALVAREPAVLVAAVGEQMFVIFAQAFLGAEHIEAMQHLLILNNATEHKGIAHARNLRTLVFNIYSLMREVTAALATLDAMRVGDRLDAAKPHWAALTEIRRRWEANKSVRDVRDKVAFHQDAKRIEAALRAWPATEPLVLVEGEHQKDGSASRANSRMTFPTTLSHVPMDEAWFEQAVDDHLALSRHLQPVFVDVLRKAGVKFREDAPEHTD
jgi:hypothetical protein